jgi:hypothetical protein
MKGDTHEEYRRSNTYRIHTREAAQGASAQVALSFGHDLCFDARIQHSCVCG